MYKFIIVPSTYRNIENLRVCVSYFLSYVACCVRIHYGLVTTLLNLLASLVSSQHLSFSVQKLVIYTQLSPHCHIYINIINIEAQKCKKKQT